MPGGAGGVGRACDRGGAGGDGDDGGGAWVGPGVARGDVVS